MSAVAVREVEDRVVGLAIMAEHGMPRSWDERQMHTLRPGECYLHMLCVLSEARGKGVGSVLLRWCEATAVARGAEFLSLGVVAGNPAQRLYERKGFEVMHSSGCCGNLVMCFFLGLPHCRCGVVSMEKVFESGGTDMTA